MKKIHKEFATKHLYRIFLFERGNDRDHDLSVRAFQDFLHDCGISYSIRALYNYIEGKIPFPAVLMPYLIKFSRDEKLIAEYLPAIKYVINELKGQYETEERTLENKIERIKRAKKDLSL